MKPIFKLVDNETFFHVVNQARGEKSRIAENVTPYKKEEYKVFKCFLMNDKKAGFAIKKENGELCSVFSIEKGRGLDIVQNAVKKGAKILDCFDGYLPAIYSKAGFIETEREKNWVEGGPDVVYMRRAA